MTSLREAVERLRAWQNSVDKPSADHQFLADVQLVLDSLSPSDDLREGVEKFVYEIERVIGSHAWIRSWLLPDLLAFITAREAGKDAEIASIDIELARRTALLETAQADSAAWKQRALDTRDQRDALAARLEKMGAGLLYGIGAAINELAARGLPREWAPDSGIGRMVEALGLPQDPKAVIAILADGYGSTTVPARETAASGSDQEPPAEQDRAGH